MELFVTGLSLRHSLGGMYCYASQLVSVNDRSCFGTVVLRT